MPACIPIDRTTDFGQWSRLWRAYLEFYRTTLPEEQYRDTFDRLVDPDGDLGGFVLVDDHNNGILIGLTHYLYHTSAWAPAKTRQCYLNDLYVDPATRGSGGGRRLIEAVEREARTRGCSRVYWLTAPDNLAARKLYDAMAVTNRVAYKIDL